MNQKQDVHFLRANLIQRKDTDHVLGVGKLYKNLYVIESLVENHLCNFFHPQETTLDKWYNFLGHPSVTTLKHMKGLSGQLTHDTLQKIENCEIRVKARHVRDKFLS